MQSLLILINFFILIFLSACSEITVKGSRSANQSVELSKNTNTDKEINLPVGVSTENATPIDDQLNQTTENPFDHEKVNKNAKSITSVNTKTSMMQFSEQNERALILIGMLKYWESRGHKSFFIMTHDDRPKFLNQILKLYQKKGSANLVEWVIFQQMKNIFPRKADDTKQERDVLFEEMAEKLESDFSLSGTPDPIHGDCEKLRDYLKYSKKGVCFFSDTRMTPPLSGTSALVLNSYAMNLPENYLTQFALADYLSFGQKLAKELIGKLK
jgi:hypothetical protein